MFLYVSGRNWLETLKNGGDALVRHPGGDYYDITRLDVELPPLWATELQRRLPLRHTKRLVRGRMVMVIGEDRVPPLRRPVVLPKQLFHCLG